MKKKVLIISLCLLIIALWAASIYLVLELNNTSTNNPDLSTNMDVSTTLKESELQNDSSFSVGNYLYNSLSKTIEELSTKGFDNYIYLDQAGNSISNIHGYIIIGQKPEVGTAISYSDSITFTCVSFQAYLDEKIIGQPINEVKQALIDLNYIDVTYINDKTGEDVTYTIETLTEEEYVDWNVIGAIDVSTPAMRRMEIRLEKVLKEYQLFIDISFTENSFSNKDNIELRLLNEDVSVGKYILPHGKPFSKLITVTEGEYSLAFYKENAFTVNNHTESFTISGDLTFSCNISITSNGITIENENTSSSLEGSALTVPSVVGLTLTQASQNLTECGFVNLEGMKENGETAGSLSTWVVISQSVSEGETLTKADLIVLTCMKADDYMKQKYENAALGEVKAEIEAMGFSSISYKLNFLNDITTTISQADQASLAKYTITSTTTTNNKITIYLQFAE